jgi:hypothetical protein
MTLSTDENPSLARRWLRAIRYQLTQPFIIALAIVMVGGSIILNWGWLAAAGLLPFVVCPIICGLGIGLCRKKRNGN